MSAPDIPSNYDFDVTVDGSVDVGLDDVRVKEVPVIRLEGSLKEIPTIKTDSVVSLGLDNIQIKQLPKLELELGVKPTRVHYPSHYKLCGSLFGFEVFSFSICGEGMVITEPYVPHKTETCH